jgi:hypothetical protein
MNSNLLSQSFKFCSVLDKEEQFEKSDKIFKVATIILAQSKGYDPANPLTPYTDPTTIERSEGIPGSGTVFFADDLLSKLKGVPNRFKNIKMQELTSWMSTMIPFFNPNNPQEIEEFRTRIFPNIINRDIEFWKDFKKLTVVLNKFILEKALPSEITGDPVIDQQIKDNMLDTVANILHNPLMSVINDELDSSLIP